MDESTGLFAFEQGHDGIRRMAVAANQGLFAHGADIDVADDSQDDDDDDDDNDNDNTTGHDRGSVRIRMPASWNYPPHPRCRMDT